MRIVAHILIVMLLFAIPVKASSIENGKTLFNEGKYSDAITVFETQKSNLLTLNCLAELHFYLGAAYIKVKSENSDLYSPKSAYKAWKVCKELDMLSIWNEQMVSIVEGIIENTTNNEEAKKMKYDLALISKFIGADLSVEASNIEYMFSLAQDYNENNIYHMANNSYNKVVTLYHKRPKAEFQEKTQESYFHLADDYFYRQGEKDLALEFVTNGLNINEENQKLEVLEAMILNSMPDKRNAGIEKIDLLIVKYPNNTQLLLYQAKNLERKDPDKAAEYYTRLLEYNKDDEDMLFFLGSYYVNKADDRNGEGAHPREVLDLSLQGISYFEQLHNLNPTDKDTIKTLIRFYGYINRKADVEVLQKKLAEL